MALPPCPRCGSTGGTYVAARADGPVQLFFDRKGNYQEALYDDLRFVPHTKTVRCVDCLKIRRGLQLTTVIDRQIVQRKPS